MLRLDNQLCFALYSTSLAMTKLYKPLLERLGLPTRVAETLGEERIIAAMGSDKKNRAGAIRFALPRGVGTMGAGPEWTTEAGEPAIRAALRAIS